jgi:hypothetical protein
MGHWEYRGRVNIHNVLGFVYCITNTISLKRYIGRKQLWFRRGRKRYESDWKTYTGSSKELTKDVKKEGVGNFTFKILSFFSNKMMLRYAETSAIIDLRALENQDDWYNRGFDNVRYSPVFGNEDRNQLKKLRASLNDLKKELRNR